MPLTEKQLNNIERLDIDSQLEIVHSCVESLGLATVSEYATIMCINRREVYRLIKANKVRWIKLSEIYFIVINAK